MIVIPATPLAAHMMTRMINERIKKMTEQAYSPTTMGRGLFNEKKVIKESHTRDEAHIVGLVDKEGNVWHHRSDLIRNSKHSRHTSKYPDVYKNASPGYLHNSNRVHSAWHNTKTNQVHEGSPSYGDSSNPRGGITLSPFIDHKFHPLDHYNVEKEKKD